MNNPYRIMKSDEKLFRKYALKNRGERETKGLLAEHFPMLARCARQSADECRKIEKQLADPEILPGLFDRCAELCKDGILPDSVQIIDKFKDKISGFLLSYLPLGITCALIHKCAESVTADNSDMLAKSVLSLQKMRNIDFGFISEELFSAEEILISDPSGIYSDMSRETKEIYRRKIAEIALENNKTEKETATDFFEKAKENNEHIGKFLFSKRKNKAEIYLILEAVMPLLVCISSAILSGEWIMSFLLYFPVWEILRYPVERASMRSFSPKKFASLDINSKTVSESRTLITLSVILSASDEINELKNRLEDLYLSNAYGNVKVCCLADFKAADSPRKPEDRHIMNALNEVVDKLNEKYGGGFILAVRPRSYSETQNEFIGKERKRGAIRELIRAIKGNEKEFMAISGDKEGFSETKYLFALDYDSKPVFDSLRDLVAIAEHPLNKPVIKNGKVVSGYGIFAPKTQNSLESASKTFFSSVMSQSSGISSYDMYSTERYQLLFGESIFCGKGLINVDAYHEILDRKLPKERILSHDIVEGEFLRTGFVPSAQITEDFPSTADAYFKRLHRWVRGDWQNLCFIHGKNRLGFVSGFKLFDNLRRSITPVICIAVILYSSFVQDYAGVIGAAISLLALCASDVFAGIMSVLNGGTDSVTGLFYSKRLPEGLGCFVRAFFSVAYSVRESVICFDASVRALWRVYISGDRLLEWTTSAASEQNANKKFTACIPAVLTASALIAFGFPMHRMAGLLILGEIPLTIFGNSSVKQKKSGITSDQKEYLLSLSSSMWEYFEDLCGEENNFLPPDNIQFAPHRAVARRTSPTNIGLMLACFLAARDFGFITSEELCRRLNRSLTSIEKLEKYKGNLLNWYSTSTLEVLPPRFVSSVDSGNFLCCLTAVKEGIKEYVSECAELKNTATRIENIINATDLSIMFNNHRKIFSIGINPENEEKTESCYDLYMSEMRMTSYFAVARRLVPKSLWTALDRPIVRNGRYSGLASWTGTMFEYFMADIFIPAPYGSLSDEALRFCLQSQRKKAGRNPFGMSESGFYAFDGELNYQYKAHGVQKLAFRRYEDKDNVISPYSSFLTLNIAPQVSLKNLRKLEKFGMKGKYGFCEAIDLSSESNYGGYSLVNSFMVHHVGMSFLSVDNLLNHNCMQNRFMSDSFMRGAGSLLEEKPVSGEEVFKDVVSDKVIPTVRERVQKKSGVWNKAYEEAERFSVLSNGRMAVFINNKGKIKVMIDGEEAWNEMLSAVFECGKIKYNFLNEKSEMKITDCTVEFRTRYDSVCVNSKIFVMQNCNCLFMKYEVENKLDSVLTGKMKIIKNENKNNLFVAFGFIDAESEFGENCLETDLEIKSGKSKELISVYATEASETEAKDLFETMKAERSDYKKAKNPFYKDEFIRALSDKYLPALINCKSKGDKGLYQKYGISEDYPIITVLTVDKNNTDVIRKYVVFNKILRNCGIKNTLVIYVDAQKDAKTSALQTIESILNEERCNLMIGIGGGIFVFNEENLNKTEYEHIVMKSQVYEKI